MAVVAMVEPEIAEKMVPATTATTARRPGTCAIRRSTPSITFTAIPVWNSTSPISMNSGIGVSEKLVMETTLLRASCSRPGCAAEPDDRAEDVDRDEGEGDRQAEEQQERSSRRASATRQIPRTSGGGHRVVARAALAVQQAAHAEQHLDRRAA